MDYNYNLKAVMSVREVADFLGIGVNQDYGLVRAKKIKTLPLNHRIKIPRHAVLEFMGAEQTAG